MVCCGHCSGPPSDLIVINGNLSAECYNSPHTSPDHIHDSDAEVTEEEILTTALSVFKFQPMRGGTICMQIHYMHGMGLCPYFLPQHFILLWQLLPALSPFICIESV